MKKISFCDTIYEIGSDTMKLTELDPKILLTIFYIWGNAISILFLIVLLIRNKRYKESISHLFINLIILLMIYFLADAFWALPYFEIIKEPAASIILKCIRMVYYTSLGLASVFWSYYIESLLDSNFYHSKKKRLLYIPFIIETIYAIIACILLDPAKRDIGGYLLTISLVLVPIIYTIFAGIRILRARHNEKDDLLKRRYRNLAILPYLILGATVIQIFIPELPIFCFIASILIITLYLFNQDSLINTDPLTGVNNRSILKKYFNEIKGKNDIYYIMMVDIDNFKAINDNYGHLNGDKALIFLAEELKKVSANKSCFVARYGGDEFILIIKTDDEDEIKKLMFDISLALAKQNDVLNFTFTVSIGYAKMEKDDNIDDIIIHADEKLYKAKAKIHN